MIINNISGIIILRVSSYASPAHANYEEAKPKGGGNMNRKIIKSALVVLDTLLKIIIIYL